jgi:hypothetical protein
MNRPEMTYERWCANSERLLKEAEAFNKWRERAKFRLLTDIAPRIGKLSQQFYTGCGFHYSLEQQLSKLLSDLSLPIQWCANHCGKIPEQQIRMMINEVCMPMLVNSVVKAEKSAVEWAQKTLEAK